MGKIPPKWIKILGNARTVLKWKIIFISIFKDGYINFRTDEYWNCENVFMIILKLWKFFHNFYVHNVVRPLKNVPFRPFPRQIQNLILLIRIKFFVFPPSKSGIFDLNLNEIEHCSRHWPNNCVQKVGSDRMRMLRIDCRPEHTVDNRPYKSYGTFGIR